MRLNKPDRLLPGDRVGIIAPASAPADPTDVDRAIEAVEKLGFKPVLARHARKRWGFLAGSDRERAADLMSMFASRRIKGILCIRGGYGSARLLQRLEFDQIRSNPKVFIGYSDITALHCALLTKSGLVSFHGPMLKSDLIKENRPPFTVDSLTRAVCHAAAPGSICIGYDRKTVTILRTGEATGVLIGGNLTILCTTLGTPWQPRFKNSILLLEEVDEEPYRMDRMLTHLLNAGVLRQVTGIAIGICNSCSDPKAAKAKEYRQTLEDVFRERLLPLKVPVVRGLPFGHDQFNATLPIGVRATIDGRRGDLIIEEAAVL